MFFHLKLIIYDTLIKGWIKKFNCFNIYLFNHDKFVILVECDAGLYNLLHYTLKSSADRI